MNYIIKEQVKTVSIIRMVHEKKKNSLEKEFRDGLKKALYDFGSDKTSRVAILTGTDTIFCAGGSLTELAAGMTVFAGVDYMKDNSEIVRIIANLDKPVIAAINGVAVGAGVSIALACDLTIASSQAIFSLGFNTVGLVPDLGCIYFLPRLIGLQQARALLFTGGTLKADEALKKGLIGQVVASDDLMPAALDLSQRISEGPSRSMGLCKSLLLKSTQLSLDDVLAYEAFAQAICFQSGDHKEGLNAFLEKRPANFSGE
jgi:2-(1,2-epoxy-1,2-dihydrophenyl)acetyl-CoA isomerase